MALGPGMGPIVPRVELHWKRPRTMWTSASLFVLSGPCWVWLTLEWTADHADQGANGRFRSGGQELLQIASGRGNQPAPHWLPGGVESRARFGRGASRGFPRHGSGQPRDADAVIVLATAGVATAVASLGAPALVKASRPRPQEAILRFGYLAPDIVAAIVEGRQPRSLTVKRLLQGIPCAWADQRTAFGLAR